MRDLYTCAVCGFLSTARGAYVRAVPHMPGTFIGRGFLPPSVAPLPTQGEVERLVCQRCAALVGQNVDSIEAIPRALLPDGPARAALIAQAQQGEDVYAYTAHSVEGETWYLWSEARADADAPTRNGRVTVSAWVKEWEAAHPAVADPTPV